MRHFIELITDKRFSLKFRIPNLLSGDYLRNYLAVGVYSPILHCQELLNTEGHSEKYIMKALKHDIDKAKKGMDDVWYL